MKTTLLSLFSILILQTTFAQGSWKRYMEHNTDLPYNQTQKVYFASDGTGYIGTKNGLGVFKDTGFVANYTTSNSSLISHDIKDIIEYDSLILIATKNDGVFVLEDEAISPYIVESVQLGGSAFAINSQGNLMSVAGAKLKEVTDSGIIEHTLPHECHSIFCTSSGINYLGSLYNEGLVKGATDSYSVMDSLDLPTGTKVFNVLVDENNAKWLGTNEGIIKILANGTSWITTTATGDNLGENTSLDRIGDEMFVGCYNGIYKLNDADAVTDTVWTKYYDPDSIMQDIRDMAKHDDKFYFATGGGLYVWDPNGVSETNNISELNAVLDFVYDFRSNTLNIQTILEEVNLLNINGQLVKKFSSNSINLSSFENGLYFIQGLDKDNKIYYGKVMIN